MDTNITKIVVFSTSFLLFSVSNSAFAAGSNDQSNSTLSSLAGDAVPAAQLGALRARGTVIVSSVNNGTVANNSINGNSVTGKITDIQSANNNAGLTTIFQNTGNNALLQNSTSVYISVH